jgi:hypothetical protein
MAVGVSGGKPYVYLGSCGRVYTNIYTYVYPFLAEISEAVFPWITRVGMVPLGVKQGGA